MNNSKILLFCGVAQAQRYIQELEFAAAVVPHLCVDTYRWGKNSALSNKSNTGYSYDMAQVSSHTTVNCPP